MGGNSWQYRYDTGWINRSDWTNVHLGSDATLNVDSNVLHNLNAPLSELLVRVFISTDGTDANSFEILPVGRDTNTGTGISSGIVIYQVDLNNVKVQTGGNGLLIMDDTGSAVYIDTENYYYKVKVWYVG